MSKISILVPVYNVEKYIRKCLDSLVNQTFSDYEVLVINDGSPDNSQDIIDEYVSKYPCVKSIVKENGGYGSVLQLGINKCESEYFLVCDPDDYITSDCLEHLYSLAIKHNSDIVIGTKTLVYEDDPREDYDKSFNDDFVNIEDEEVFEFGKSSFEKLYFIDPSPHAKLYKKSLAQNIVFPHKVSFTDNLLYFICLGNAEKVVYSKKPCAYYLINRVGNTMTSLKPKTVSDHAVVLSEIIKQNQNCNHKNEMVYYRMFEAFKFVFRNLRLIDGSDEEKNVKANELYEVIENLKAHKKETFDYLNKYSKDQVVEKLKDKMIFWSKKYYLSWARKQWSSHE